MPKYDEYGNPIESYVGEVVTSEQRIKELEDENNRLKGESRHELTKFLENPSQLKEMFNLSEGQALNVRSLISGAGSAAAVKYLSRHIGSELAAGVGGFVAAYIAKRMLGGK